MRRGSVTGGPHSPAGTLLALAAALAVLAACGTEEGTVVESEGARTVTVTETRTAEATSSQQADASASAGGGETTPGLGELEPGTHHVLLEGLSDGVVDGEPVQVLALDKVDFLTGQEAVDAALEAGVIGPDEGGVPNDYFIRNENPLIRQLPVLPDSEVLLLVGGSPELEAGTLEDAVAADTLFQIQVTDVDGVSTITEVRGFYVP
jgi:hypothetical protein